MKYRKKPIDVEVFQWNGNLDDLVKWARSVVRSSYQFNFAHVKGWFGKNELIIRTNKGKMKAAIGDYIIRGIENEFYPVKPDIFKKTYEQAENL